MMVRDPDGYNFLEKLCHAKVTLLSFYRIGRPPSIFFIEPPLISVVKEQSNMLDYQIYYFVGALSLTII
jgi:hypothetical protein